MKDGKITLDRAVKCYTPYRISKGHDSYSAASDFKNKYGFSFEECWNLDQETAYYILIRLVQFRKNVCSFPCSFEGEKGLKRWKTQLDKMIRGFYLYCSVDFPTEKQKKVIRHGQELFVKYFECLWD